MSEMDFTRDSLFECLAERRRRVVLSYLLDSDSGGRSATVEDLVDAVVEAESHSPSPDPDSVAITLDHVHLPLLADTGLIEYDRDRGVVTTTTRTTDVDPYLDGEVLGGEVTSEEEFHRELGELFASAHRNGVSLGPVSIWVCRHTHSPDRELMITELNNTE